VDDVDPHRRSLIARIAGGKATEQKKKNESMPEFTNFFIGGIGRDETGMSQSATSSAFVFESIACEI